MTTLQSFLPGKVAQLGKTTHGLAHENSSSLRQEAGRKEV
jgi:hypothetical protein